MVSFKIRKVSDKYSNIQLLVNNETIDLGLCDKAEQADLARDLISFAADLIKEPTDLKLIVDEIYGL